MHKVGNVGIFVLLKLDNRLDRPATVSPINFNSMPHAIFKFA